MPRVYPFVLTDFNYVRTLVSVTKLRYSPKISELKWNGDKRVEIDEIAG